MAKFTFLNGSDIGSAFNTQAQRQENRRDNFLKLLTDSANTVAKGIEDYNTEQGKQKLLEEYMNGNTEQQAKYKQTEDQFNNELTSATDTLNKLKQQKQGYETSVDEYGNVVESNPTNPKQRFSNLLKLTEGPSYQNANNAVSYANVDKDIADAENKVKIAQQNIADLKAGKIMGNGTTSDERKKEIALILASKYGDSTLLNQLNKEAEAAALKAENEANRKATANEKQAEADKELQGIVDELEIYETTLKGKSLLNQSEVDAAYERNKREYKRKTGKDWKGTTPTSPETPTEPTDTNPGYLDSYWETLDGPARKNAITKYNEGMAKITEMQKQLEKIPETVETTEKEFKGGKLTSVTKKVKNSKYVTLAKQIQEAIENLKAGK